MYLKIFNSSDPAQKRKTIETFVEKVIVFRERFECHFHIESVPVVYDKLPGQLVSDMSGGGEALWTVSLTLPRNVRL